MQPYYSHNGIEIYCGDAREVYKEIGFSENRSVFIDLPYNAGKAYWDNEFPYWWFDVAGRMAPVVGVTPGIDNILRCPAAFAGGCEYRWTLSAHLINGMTRGRLGFANWIPCLLFGRPDFLRYEPRQDCKDFAIGSERKPDHPSPKPYNVTKWFLSFLEGVEIVDFFVGSGTTLRAAKDLGMRAIGVDKDERYCQMAAENLQQEVFEFTA